VSDDLITLTIREVYNTKRVRFKVEGIPDDAAHKEAEDACSALYDDIEAGVWAPVEFVARVGVKAKGVVEGYVQERLL
jgi:hypothetical protein